MITVEGIPCRDVAGERELLAEYAAECSIPAIGVPNPQWEMYGAMEAAGFLQVFAVYVDGCMAGFASVLVVISPHYGVKLANVESLFVSKRCRWTRAGAVLMRVVERHAAGVGCKALGRWRNGRSLWKVLR